MVLLVLLACRPAWSPEERALILAMSPLPAPSPSPTNRLADSPDAAAVGHRIFFDPGFSANGAVACATCHVPELHHTDGRTVGQGIAAVTRNTPTVETVAWQTWFFWDGRADSAWAQAAGPLTHPKEHGLDAAGVRARVLAAYAEDWARLWGEVAEDPERVLAEVGKVLEAYERTLSPGDSRFDRWAAGLAAGRDDDTLTAEEKAGLRLFVGRAGCVRCHHGPLLTDHSFHNLGLPQTPGFEVDPGRADGAPKVLADPRNCRGPYADPAPCDELRYLDPTFADWAAAFKTPSLRNVAVTGPYMHAGQFATLDEVVRFYDTLPGQPLLGHRELTLQPLGLTEAERAALVAFLGALTAER